MDDPAYWQMRRRAEEAEADRDRLRAERDQLREQLHEIAADFLEDHMRDVVAERDRLRAVVEAAHDLVMAFDTQPDYGQEMDALRAALLAQLDVSPTMGGEVVPGDRDDSLLAAIRADRRQTSEGCSTCGTPYRWQRKWNSGNPKDFLLSDCACEPEAVDPTSPTYDPDQYGTFTQSDGARNSPLGDTGPSAGGPGSHVAVVSVSPADDQGVGTGNPDALDQTSEGDDDLTVAVDPSDHRGAGTATPGTPSGDGERVDL